MKKVFNANRNATHEGWHKNTDLGCDVKTILLRDRQMKPGKTYRGVLQLDAEAATEEYLSSDAHYTFTETLTETRGKRNPRVYSSCLLTVTRWDDGSLHPYLKPVAMESHDFTVDGYALAVCNELRQALTGLVEEE